MSQENGAYLYSIWKKAEDSGLMGVKEIAPYFKGQGIDISHSDLERVMHRTPIKDFVYPGTMDTLRWLRDEKDLLDIWTLGDETLQTWKVATSGISELRRGETAEETRRLRAQVRLHASRDKINKLPEIVTGNLTPDVGHVFIVDDKSSNVLRVSQVIEQWQQTRGFPQGVEFHPVWINQGRTQNVVPKGYDLPGFLQQFDAVNAITELPDLRSRYASEGKRNLWELDFDHTLASTREWEQMALANLKS